MFRLVVIVPEYWDNFTFEGLDPEKVRDLRDIQDEGFTLEWNRELVAAQLKKQIVLMKFDMDSRKYGDFPTILSVGDKERRDTVTKLPVVCYLSADDVVQLLNSLERPEIEFLRRQNALLKVDDGAVMKL